MLFSCRMSGVGGRGRANSVTLKFYLLDINYRDETLHDIKYTSEIYIYRKKIEKHLSLFPDISVSMPAHVEEFVKDDQKAPTVKLQ